MGWSLPRWRTALLLFLLLLPLACQGDSPSTATPQSLVVYTALEDDQLPAYLELFEKAHPNIEVEIVRESTGTLTDQLLAELDAPKAEVIWGVSAVSLQVLEKAGLLVPYAPKELEAIDPLFRDNANPPYWVGIDAWMTAFCVNTELTEAQGLPIPASWTALADPIYKGQIVMPNPASSGTGYFAVASLISRLGEEDGWEFLDRLHENMALYTHSGSEPCKRAGAGEYPIGVSFGYRAVTQRNQGDPIVPVFPPERSGWDMEANALTTKGAENPAAKTFLDWAISREAMVAYGKNFAITARPNGQPIPDGFPIDPRQQLLPQDFGWMAEQRERILAEWLARYDEKSAPRD